MSHPPSNQKHRSTAESASDERTLYRKVRHYVRVSVRTLGFWTAVALPFLYIPLLFTGIDTSVEVTAFISLLMTNVVALPAGHAHLIHDDDPTLKS
jgi:hypothetical protein